MPVRLADIPLTSRRDGSSMQWLTHTRTTQGAGPGGGGTRIGPKNRTLRVHTVFSPARLHTWIHTSLPDHPHMPAPERRDANIVVRATREGRVPADGAGSQLVCAKNGKPPAKYLARRSELCRGAMISFGLRCRNHPMTFILPVPG
jgi:hypothetical protein